MICKVQLYSSFYNRLIVNIYKIIKKYIKYFFGKNSNKYQDYYYTFFFLFIYIIIYKNFIRHNFNDVFSLCYLIKIYKINFIYILKLFWKRSINDPSAGSPTETLLRLLLPLNNQVRSTSAKTTVTPKASQ